MSYNETKEDQVSLSDNNCLTRTIKYDTKAKKRVYSTKALAEILSEINSIDYLLVYHQDNEGLISYILSLREKLGEEKDYEDKEK